MIIYSFELYLKKCTTNPSNLNDGVWCDLTTGTYIIVFVVVFIVFFLCFYFISENSISTPSTAKNSILHSWYGTKSLKSVLSVKLSSTQNALRRHATMTHTNRLWANEQLRKRSKLHWWSKNTNSAMHQTVKRPWSRSICDKRSWQSWIQFINIESNSPQVRQWTPHSILNEQYPVWTRKA